MIPKRTRTVELRFLRSQLLYDAANYAFVAGDVMKAEDEHGRHQVVDMVEDGNVDRVTRVLNLAVAECREILYPYTKVEVEGEESRNDVLAEVPEYVIRMLVPDDFSKTTVTFLEQLIHELLVDRIMADWMSLTKPEDKAVWEEKAEAVIGKINSCKNYRTGKVRRPLHPF